MNEGQGKTDSQTTESTIIMLAVRHTEDYHQEDESQHCLNSERTACRSMQITGSDHTIRDKEITIAVRSERTNFHTFYRLNDTEQDSSSRDSAEDLCTPVPQHLFGTHAAVHEHTEADSRIEMRTADMADTIRSCYDRQTEG